MQIPGGENEKKTNENQITPHLHPELPAQVTARGDNEGLGERAAARNKKAGGTFFSQNPSGPVLSQLLADKLLE